MSTSQRNHGVTRRQMLKSTAMSLPALALGLNSHATFGGPSRRDLPKNVILFMTDQQRATQHFPPGWEEQNLPGLTRLKSHGLTFENAFTNACMCSPARSTLMSGYFPAQHGVKYTLEKNMPEDRRHPQVELPSYLPNIATVMSASGFNSVYKGKWHCSKQAGTEWDTSDLNQYGFHRWNPPDGGANQEIDEAARGPKRHDERYMHYDGPWQNGKEGVLAYLNKQSTAQQPFFLVVSLINPHDVLLYPRVFLNPEERVKCDYDNTWLSGNIELPATVGENLLTKPRAQILFRALLDQGLGSLSTPEEKRNYLNFYANLIKSSDGYLVEILNALEKLSLLDDTLIIYTADHGEMGMTHGGLRQKNFNFYEETIRIPLVYSNSRMYKKAHSSSALVSHVDFVPTMASLFNAPANACGRWQGRDYSSLLLNPSAGPVQDHIIFTYDDYQAGQTQGPYVLPPNHIVSIRESRYKLARYYGTEGLVRSEWEMYDLQTDPLETVNLAYMPWKQPWQVQVQFARLWWKLLQVQTTRLQPLIPIV